MLVAVGTIGKTEEDSSPFKRILSSVNIVVSLLLAVFFGILWTIIDPILEPELRDKVSNVFCFRRCIMAKCLTLKCINKAECSNRCSSV